MLPLKSRNAIQSAKSRFPRRVTQAQAPGVRMGTLARTLSRGRSHLQGAWEMLFGRSRVRVTWGAGLTEQVRAGVGGCPLQSLPQSGRWRC